MNFDDIKRLADGFRRMEFDDFAWILKETNGASIDYASGCWKSFKDSPLYYVTSRRPDTQGKALIEKAWELGK